ncbi:MAG: transmembrane 220 family protein, partial [Deltaproteobacteria bacterium]
MTGLLILSAIVQWNDPDPLRWILCYSVTAFITLCSLIRSLPPY